MMIAVLPVLLWCGCAPRNQPKITPTVNQSVGPVWLPQGQSSDPRNAATLLAIFAELRIGASEREVAEVLGRAFLKTKTSKYTALYPFRDLLPETAPAVVSEWESETVQSGGWPQIVFAVFADKDKSSLVDAIWFNAGDVRPIVDGRYNQALRAVKKGDSVRDVYRHLGKRRCDYFVGADGKWAVRFDYWGYLGRSYVIHADAAEGRVLSAGYGTI